MQNVCTRLKNQQTWKVTSKNKFEDRKQKGDQYENENENEEEKKNYRACVTFH